MPTEHCVCIFVWKQGKSKGICGVEKNTNQKQETKLTLSVEIEIEKREGNGGAVRVEWKSLQEAHRHKTCVHSTLLKRPDLKCFC
jgi:hypothetical protein